MTHYFISDAVEGGVWNLVLNQLFQEIINVKNVVSINKKVNFNRIYELLLCWFTHLSNAFTVITEELKVEAGWGIVA